MANSQGFWSYVHVDDQAEGERISRLARDVVNQFELLTGETIALFLDKDALEWGVKWHEEIDLSLASIAFFIPVITPRYFLSSECRRELQYFARRATNLGLKELIMPLLYVDFPAFHDEGTKDELIVLVRTFQWEDWHELRFSEVNSEGYRRGVAHLATRLIEANKQAEEKSGEFESQPSVSIDGSVEELPGIIDLLAQGEEMLGKLPDTLDAIKQDMELISAIMKESTENIRQASSQGKGFAVRQLLIRRTANLMKEPVERIWSFSNVYVSQIHDVDQGFRVIIDRAPGEIDDNPDSRANFCSFFETVRKLSASSLEALQATQGMIDAIEPLERTSRDLRPVVRRLKQGLTIMMESKEVNTEWVHLIESSGVVCEGTVSRIPSG